MDIIQTFIKKHNGVYFEEFEKSTHTPIGKYSSQEIKGNIIYKGSKIKISIIEVGGADPVAEPFRMKILLDFPTRVDLLIFPRSYWSEVIRSFLSSRKDISIKKLIAQQYKFTGQKSIIDRLKSNANFLSKRNGEHVCINVSKKTPRVITITPEHGYRSVEHLEKLADILKIIESEITYTS